MMSQNNFVIQDVVEHVYHESDYRTPRALQHALRKIIAKIWIFVLIMGLSAGIGYVAVYLPDSMERKQDSVVPMRGVPKEFNNLSDEQKRELMKQLGGLR